MKTVLIFLTLLITLNIFSQKDRVDIFKVKRQIVKSQETKIYNVTDMYLALRFKGDTMDLNEVQITHKLLNRTEKYLVTNSEISLEDEYYGQVYFIMKNVVDNKYYKIMITFDYEDLSVRILQDKINKSYVYELEYLQKIYK